MEIHHKNLLRIALSQQKHSIGTTNRNVSRIDRETPLLSWELVQSKE